MHILIADDHKPVRENLRSLIKEQEPQWLVSEAADGLEAVELFRNAMPDVVVLDIVMEPVGGVAAAYEIRRIKPSARIVFISSHYSERDASLITRLLGAAGFVAKSEAIRSLVPTIKQSLRDSASSN